MAVRKLRESNNLSKLEICNILVDYGFGNEEEGYLDYFLDNPKYCASVNLDDMGAYVDDYDEGEHVKLPYANGADRKILRTKEDVDEFLDFIADLENERYIESKMRKTVNKRSIKEDYDDWEIIAKFRSKPFCIGDIDDVEDCLIDLMNTDEVAFKQIVDYLKSEGYSVGGEDFDADDYADWFTRELNDLFSVHNESDLKFGYFDFKVKNLSAYYDESIKRNKKNDRKYRYK